MSIKNCPDCCFTGDIDDDEAYPFGVLTEEESDQKYAKKEYEQKVDKNTADIKNLGTSTAVEFANAFEKISEKADKTEVNSLAADLTEALGTKASKAELDAFAETTAESISELENTVNTKAEKDEVNKLASDKADKTEVERLANVVETKANKDEVNSLATDKADKTEVGELANAVETKADKSNTYTKAETEEKLSAKADNSVIQTINSSLQQKANQSSVDVINASLSNKADNSSIEALNNAFKSKADLIYVRESTKELQEQINSLVTPVTVDSEVILARTDDEGETFSTLKARIDKTSRSYRDSDTSVLKDYKMYVGLMNASGTAWTNLNNPDHQHFAIKIEPFSEIKIKANSMSPLYYACLAEYDLEQNPVLADGFTSRKLLATNASDSFRSGKNSEYLYISAITEGKDSVPEYLEINGYIYTDTIKANLTSLIPFKNEYVTPQMFGAIADGVHDDLQAIQTAIDKGGNIFFPKGNYLVSNTIHVVKSNTHLVLHPQAIIECNSVTSSDPVYGNGGATINFGYGSTSESDVEYINDVGIEGGIVRNTSPGDNENAIGFSHVNKFHVRNVTIPSCNRKGITAQYWCRNGIIENNKIMSCGFRGISIEFNCDYIDIVNNFIQNDQTGGIRVSDCNYVKIERNNIRQTLGIGIQATRSGVEILHNIVFASNERCISINEEGEAVDDYPASIIGNIVRSSGQYSIYIASKSLPVTLSNNKDLSTSLANGMVLYNAHGIIMGNIVNRFLISNANGNSTVIGNIFYRFSANSGEGDYIPIILGNTIKDEYGGNLTLPIYLDILNNELHSSL